MIGIRKCREKIKMFSRKKLGKLEKTVVEFQDTEG